MPVVSGAAFLALLGVLQATAVGAVSPTFDSSYPIPLPTSSVGDLEVGDLDHDGRLDLVAVTAAVGGHGGVVWLRGMGDGLFEIGGVLDVFQKTHEAAVGDLDGDGNLDIAVTASEPSLPGRGAVAILRGGGDGTFEDAAIHQLQVEPRDVLIEDIDVDVHPDIVLTTSLPAGDIVTLRGAGDGTLGASAPISSGAGAARLAAGQLNRDRWPDLVASIPGPTSYPPSGGLAVLLGRGRASSWRAGFTDEVGSARAVRVHDLDGDGAVDVAVLVGLDRGFGESATVVVHPGSASGGLGAPLRTSTGSVPMDLLLGDFDNDGAIDAAVVAGGDILLLGGVGDGTFTPPVAVGLNLRARRLASADFNQDGRLDLAASTPGGIVVVLLNHEPTLR